MVSVCHEKYANIEYLLNALKSLTHLLTQEENLIENIAKIRNLVIFGETLAVWRPNNAQ